MSETRYERANRLADEAKARAKAQGGLDWSQYEPLPKGESLEARDAVETEAWATIEWEARTWHGVYDETETVADVIREVLAELKAEDARRRRQARPLREVLAARQMTLAYIDTGSGNFVPVETPLRVLAAPS